MERGSAKRGAVVVLILALPLVLAVGCGGEEPTPIPPTSTRVTAPPATQTPVSPTAVATSTSAPTPAKLPEPKTAAGSVVIAVTTVPAVGGLNRSGAPEHGWGAVEGLFTPTEDGKVIAGPMLAKSYEVAPNLSKVTLKIQEGVTFHGGYGELTAEDVVWSLNDANGAVTPSSIHAQAGDLAFMFGKAKAISKYEMEIPFTTFDPSWNANRSNTAGNAWNVLSKAAYDKNGEDWSRQNIIGTGPYEIVEWLSGNRIVLKAVPTHWRKVAKAQNLRFVAVPEAATRLAMLRSGEADAIPSNFKDLPALLKEGFLTADAKGGIKATLAFAGNYWEKVDPRDGKPLPVLGLSYDPKLPWAVPAMSVDSAEKMERARKVRLAMSMAIDRELINKTILNGLGWAEYLHFASVRSPQWQEKWTIPYDPAKAGQILDEAGYPKGKDGYRFDAPIFVQTPPLPGEIADAISGMWDNVGIRPTVDKSAWAVNRPSMVGRTWLKPTLWQATEGAPQRPFDWPKGAEISFLGRGGFGPGIENPKITETLLAIAKEPDLQKRINMNMELTDYTSNWMILSAVVAWPTSVTYNPRSIASWPMKAFFSAPPAYPEYIVPAR